MVASGNIFRLLTFSRFLQILSLMSAVLLVARIVSTGKLTYVFLIWNLFLAWVPYGVAIALERIEQSRGQPLFIIVLLYSVWLLFFPNAPYILTDFIHLDALTIGAVPLWYDALLISAFGVAGLAFGLRSLHLMHISWRKRFGRLFGWVSIAVVSILSGFGVYLGRFPRWNSWDVLADPTGFIYDVLERLSSPVEYPNLIEVTVSFAVLVFGSYAGYRIILRMWERIFYREDHV